MALLNDYKWFNELYEKKKRLVFKLINSKIYNLEDANDISQIVWERIFKYRKKLQNPGIRDINSYLKEIVRTTIADYYKGIMKSETTIKEYGKVIELNTVAVGNEDSHEEILDVALNRAMAMLTPEEKSLIYFTYYENNRSADVAELLGISDSLVRMRLTKIRRMLKNEINSIIAEDSVDEI